VAYQIQVLSIQDIDGACEPEPDMMSVLSRINDAYSRSRKTGNRHG
jgi:hypothetical protein